MWQDLFTYELTEILAACTGPSQVWTSWYSHTVSGRVHIPNTEGIYLQLITTH